MKKLILGSLIILFGFGFLVYHIIKFLISINQGKSRIYKELNRLRNSLNGSKIELVPIDQGELQLLSFNGVNTKIYLSQKPSIVTSIYNEPFVSYGLKSIVSGKKLVLVANTHQNEFSYIFNDGITEIFVDEHAFARILKDGDVIDVNGKSIGRIHKGPNSKNVSLNNKEMVRLNTPEKMTTTEKVFQILQPMTKKEEDLVLALSLPELLMMEK